MSRNAARHTAVLSIVKILVDDDDTPLSRASRRCRWLGLAA